MALNLQTVGMLVLLLSREINSPFVGLSLLVVVPLLNVIFYTFKFTSRKLAYPLQLTDESRTIRPKSATWKIYGIQKDDILFLRQAAADVNRKAAFSESNGYLQLQ